MKDNIENILKEYSKKLELTQDTFLGYPQNQAFSYNILYKYNFFDMCINNPGDPFTDSTYKISSRYFEKEVIKYFSKKFFLENYWGYITSCGTEGILYGMYLARELYPKGVVYYSKDSHYAVKKAVQILRMESCEINSFENGEIDYDDLLLKIDEKYPVILNLNIGTVMKGAIDNVDSVLNVFKKKNISQYYIHCDAALSGMFLEYINDAPQIDFRKDIHSVSVSGHKFIGSPFPCGVVIVRSNLTDKINNKIEYLEIQDTTLMGSRSGLTALFLWYAIESKKEHVFKTEIETCFINTEYLYKRLDAINYPVWRNKYSNTVYFKRPSEEIINKWQLAKLDDIAHIVVMQHVTKEKIDKFISDIIQNS